MPKFSAFNPFGQLRYSSKPSRFKSVYDSMRLNLSRPTNGPFALAVGSLEEAKVYGAARMVAAGDALTEKAGNQLIPTKVSDLLPNVERDYLVVPAESDSVGDRRAVLAAKKRLPAGARWSNVWNALLDLLGDDFVFYVALKDYADRYPTDIDPSTYPEVNPQRVDVPARVARLTEASATIGLAWVPYENASDADPEAVFLIGERVMVQPENTGLAENVVVEDTRTTAGVREFQATFTKSHDEGATVTTQSWPWQTSMAHHHLVIGTTTAARDPVTRRKVDDLMSRLMRGPSTWSFVEPTTLTFTQVVVGPTTVASVLGARTIGVLTYQL